MEKEFMKPSKGRAASAIGTGLLFIYIAKWILAYITASMPKPNLYIEDFADHELQSIFLATCYLSGGFLVGMIAKSKGFLLGFLAPAIYILGWYVRAALRYPPAMDDISFNLTVLLKILAWGLQAGAGGVIGALFVTSQFAQNLVVKYWAVR